MKAEDKTLLLKDLCARLPYGVFVADDMQRTYKLEIGNSYLIDLFYNNDGLSEVDWRNWFERYDLTEPLAVIHFTKFRYRYEQSNK